MSRQIDLSNVILQCKRCKTWQRFI